MLPTTPLIRAAIVGSVKLARVSYEAALVPNMRDENGRSCAAFTVMVPSPEPVGNGGGGGTGSVGGTKVPIGNQPCTSTMRCAFEKTYSDTLPLLIGATTRLAVGCPTG
jgi:hypothetical protein